VAILGIAAFAIVAGPASRRHAFAWSVVSLALIAVALQVPRAQYLHQGAFLNLWQVNQWVDPTRPYTEGFWMQTRNQPGSPLSCEPALDQEVSVVLVVVESLSAYHSKLFSGLHDYTPNLDRLAKEGTYFSRFDANEYSTQGALIALLTGDVPYPPAGSFISTMAFSDVDGDFHRWLRTEGYHTYFFTSGDLSVGQRDKWLRAIGIEYAEGAEHPFYKGMPRASFGAADDAALVDRFLAWHANERKAGPFMATMLTVETHPPFVSARTGRMDEAESFREVDRQIGRLAATLKSRGFFDRGLMIIMGDHRAMTPIPPVEQLRFGASAAARVPAVVLGKSGLARGESLARMQQTDLIPSLRYLIGEKSCRTDLQGRFLGSKPDPARYVVHADPIRRNQIGFVEGDSEYRLVLDGDDTRWSAAPPRIADADRLRNEVNHERMSRMVELHSAVAGR
jgi:lipoteichoic acid synthase